VRAVSRGFPGLRPEQGDRLVLLALTLVLSIARSEWLYNNGAIRDSWIYYGLFRRAPVLLRLIADQYFASRLSMIVPGFLLHRLLPSEVAEVALHLVICWIALLAFYEIVRALLDRRAALLASVLLVTNSFFLRAVGSDYFDGYGIAYGLLAALALVRSRTSERPLPGLVAAGAAAAAMISANIFFVVCVPVLALAHPVRPLRRWVRDSAVVAAAAAATLLLLGLASLAFGGPFLFLASSIRFAAGFSGPQRFFHPVHEWAGRAGWMVLPAIGTAAAVLGILARRRVAELPARHAFVLTQLPHLILVATFGLLHALGQAVFEYWYYASLLIPSATLALGGWLWISASGLTDSAFRRVAALTIIVTAGAHFAAPPGTGLLNALSSRFPRASMAGVAASVGVGALLALGLRGRRAASLTAAILAFSAGLWSAGQLFPTRLSFDLYGYDKRGVFREIDQCVDWLERVDPERKAHPWFNADESAGLLFDLVASTSVSNYRFLGLGFPAIENAWTRDDAPLAPGLTAYVMTQSRTPFSDAREALRRRGFDARLEAQGVADGPAGHVSLLLITVAESGKTF
jgi:hypothetical protein